MIRHGSLVKQNLTTPVYGMGIDSEDISGIVSPS